MFSNGYVSIIFTVSFNSYFGIQIVTPASWKIAEKVLRNCNDTLKSYSEKIMKLIDSNPDDYAEVVIVLCQNAHENGHVVRL